MGLGKTRLLGRISINSNRWIAFLFFNRTFYYK